MVVLLYNVLSTNVSVKTDFEFKKTSAAHQMLQKGDSMEPLDLPSSLYVMANGVLNLCKIYVPVG